ncbi:hypothetical protein N7510_000902 [Penicillium lagena]|uniref:uncharacterized protein n=1 Tax=Penicillium lagena TaxID=94218 RepID=UPI00253F806B|nr:uncharacterized protein N7510_000902 [Penicillium lagena]KAJ5624593.1 hypothetical protein N7510_000902 [Penicillium lagena]
MSAYLNEPIAIVGAGCRFSGESNRPSKLWELLRSPRPVATPIPKDRFNLEAFYHPEGAHHGSTNVLESYFLSDQNIKHFDAPFFNTNPTEADPMDPQHRQLLEVVYEGIEDAGLTIEELQGSDTAVYVGSMCNDYSAISSRDFDYIPTYGATGVAASNASSRVSYFFDWHGACMTIDTACSSSLIAMHQAVQVLRLGHSKVAIAAGTSLILDPLPYVSESNLNMLSPTGRSRMWDADADGYARGDGVAAVVLKTLSQALADGDHVECIIRETGANQDGRTKGITMPSGVAQTAMIRDTYARAGLDPLNPLERCQYFEAHGTGTPAGDPQEASALDTSFFDSTDRSDTLYVGSVKTVIGHTEGTAGLAGVLKAYLAIKNKTLPPNLLFNNLSDAVRPFYRHLQILNKAQPWPELPEGVPRRASVNSFGFGGSNAHAILESYEPSKPSSGQPKKSGDSLSLVPFVFSANSESSLKARLGSMVDFLKSNHMLALDDLRYTLTQRRSALASKAFFSASSVGSLISGIESALKEAGEKNVSVGVQSATTPATILGVFTGQGAQWPQMGLKLIEAYASARQTLNALDASLASLPPADRPAWTLLDELSAAGTASRLGEAAISQPLCTAVQIVLVDLLRAAGVSFRAVVGHSSGEIAAAYTAGFLSASDAIRVAYYRGIHARAASGVGGKKGAMMAVGTSLEDARELVDLEDFENRLAVAASNSSSSVTLSGDADAIDEAQAALDSENKFARKLKVDTAYHSHHMRPCAEPYLTSLRACNIQVLQPAENDPVWFSSVRDGARIVADDVSLRDSYWVENMANTVLFSQALTQATETFGSFALGLEVGPHPALKGPATQTYQETTNKEVPYVGVLSRGKDDVDAVASALGAIWRHLGVTGINWKALQQTYCGTTPASLAMIKDLPLYDWDHTRTYWSESRYGRQFRTGDANVHSLLGKRLPDGTAEEMRWKNILKPREIPWLAGHALQGQVVFPGTGYIALAMEAAMELAAGRAVQSIELCDLVISKAIAIDESVGTEVVVSMTQVVDDGEGADLITANFTSFSLVSRESSDLAVNASGQVRVNLGPENPAVLATRDAYMGDMATVDIDHFYGAMSELGYGYTGPFKGLSSLRRHLGYASGTIARPADDDAARPLLFHPGMLDTSLQTLFAAFSAPGDARLWAMHVPTGIHRVTLVPSLCGANLSEEVVFDSMITASRPNHITGDVDLIGADGVHKCIEIDGLGFVPFTPATAADDRGLFSRVTWGFDRPDGVRAAEGRRATAWEKQKAADCERAAFFWLRSLNCEIGVAERPALPVHHRALLDFAEHMEEVVRAGKHPHGTLEWFDDTRERILPIVESYGHDADLNIMRAVGENIVSVMRGEITILEVMTKDGYLDDYYENAMGLHTANRNISNLMAQIAYRHPHCDILEIGAGTGGATRNIFDKLGRAFRSYTYTDISTGFFGKAREEFRAYADRMVFSTLDITKDPTTQGYKEASYDVVVASNVLHATAPLVETLKNARRLLKPGGYLVVLEIVMQDAMAEGLTMGGLPGWWVGVDDGRRFAPTIPLKQWNTVLKKAGFAGIETHTPLLDPGTFIVSIFAAQAVDEDVQLLRRPLISRPDQIPIKDLILLGGETIETSNLMEDLESLLEPRTENLTLVSTIDELETTPIPTGATIVSLADVDSPIFKDITETRWNLFKNLLSDSRCVLWVTSGAEREQPYAAAMVGLHRSIPIELMQMRLQMLEVPVLKDLSASMIAEAVLRLQLFTIWQNSPVPKDLLWTSEPELKFEHGEMKIQRLLPDQEANSRYNSAKRMLTNNVDPTVSVVQLEWIDIESRYSLHDAGKPIAASEDSVTVNVGHSLLPVIRTSAELVNVALGTNAKSGEKVLVLSGENSSILTVPRSCTIAADLGPYTEGQYMTIVAAYLYSSQIWARMHSGSTLLLHEPSPIIARLLQLLCEGTKSRAFFSTTDESRREEGGWIYLHPRIARRALERSLPKDVDLFLDLSDAQGTSALGHRIAETKSQRCECGDKTDLLSKESLPLREDSLEKVAQLLQKVQDFVPTKAAETLGTVSIEPHALSSVVAAGDKCDLFTVIDWHQEAIAACVIEPIDSRRNIFQDGKTYWMVGLAGDLGQSLVDWMIDHGARHVVLTSRAPKVSPDWIATCAAKGATVGCVAGDVTDFDSICACRDEIVANYPPLRAWPMEPSSCATSFTGITHLDRLFPDDTLDWFIGFSSIVATSGNSGQSIYSAANVFMKAIVEQRRARGLAGSTIDISRVHGAGYVEREMQKSGSLSEKDINKIFRVSLAMSESDLHQLVAEAIMAGRPNSGRASELITGLRVLPSDETSDVFWANNIKFSHYIRDAAETGDEKQGKAARVAVKSQLQSAKTVEDVTTIVKAAFISKLTFALEHSEDEALSDSTPLIDFGMDSLVAVEIRSWFLQELGVDMPVLKILGGASVAELVDDAVEKLPEEFMSKFESTPKDVTKDSAESPQTLSSKSSSNLSMTDSTSPSVAPETPPTAMDDKEEFIEIEKLEEIKPKFVPEVVRKEPMSYGQARFWFLRQYSDDPTTSNITFFFRMNGRFDPERLSKTLSLITNRHESLRSCFFAENEIAYQGIMAKSAFEMNHLPATGEESARAVYEGMQNHVYDIENGDVFRATLCQVSEDAFYFVIGYHHIALDGVSWEIIFGELQRGYQSALPPVPQQYPAWAAKQRKEVESGKMSSERRFWKTQLADVPVLPLLPTARVTSRQPLKTYSMCRVQQKLDQQLTSLTKDLCKKEKVSPFHFHMAVYKTLLSRWTGANDICIGMADANRMDPGDAGVVGFLLNLLPLRFKSDGQQTFSAMMKEARTKVFGGLAHSKVPFNVILEDVNVPRTSTHNPLFQAFIEYRATNKLTSEAFKHDQPANSTSYSKTPYDITMNVLEDHLGDVIVSFGVQGALYSEETAALLLRSYITLSKTLAANAGMVTSKAQIFSDEEVSRAVALGKGPSLEQSWPKTLLHRVDEMIQTYENDTAVCDTRGNSLTYKQLANKINAIECTLKDNNVLPGASVAVFQTPAVDWICSALAIMRSGAVYVPLDPKQGTQRLAKVVETCKPAAVLVDSSTMPEAATWACKYIDVSDLQTNKSNLGPISAEADKAAIILFTSGTTGIPKGIVLHHNGLRNGIEGLIRHFKLQREVVLQQTAMSFDMSLDEIFVALCNGGALVVVDSNLRGDSASIMKLISKENITYTRATPPEYSSWIRHGASSVQGNDSWKWAFAGGDRMTDTLRKEFRSLCLPQLRLFNSYGPTEISMSAVKIETPYKDNSVLTNDQIPIGRPMPNYGIYVVNNNMDLVAPGIPGQILVGGPGVSLGYLGDSKLTDEKFINNLWASEEQKRYGWTKLYHTGDCGHLTEDGAVVFHGRIAGDTQIKLRGLRIELGDIESNILTESQGNLSHVVCTVSGDAEFLIAHVVFSPSFSKNTSDQTTYLQKLIASLPLPKYMKPAVSVPLENLPLTVHQKVDRSAIATLPLPSIGSRTDEKAGKLNEMETKLRDIWLQVLPKEIQAAWSPSTNFFDLGGNSLHLVEVLAAIQKAFHVSVPLVDLLGASTLREMTEKISDAVSAGAINWDAETTPPEIEISTQSSVSNTKKDLEVLVTGATGHFGRHLLPLLEASSKFAKIHCIAVRNPQGLSRTFKKVIVHSGDITQPRMGLSQVEFQQLSLDVDVIIHCAAARAFWEPYSVLSKTNTHSARELIKLAGPRRIPIHFMSSGGVFGGSSDVPASSAKTQLPASNGENGYIASKWASERIFERSAEAYGVPIAIYRTMPKGSRTNNSVPKKLIDDFASAVTASGTILDPDGFWKGSFDLIPAEAVATHIVSSISAASAETIQFSHLPAVVRLEKQEQLQQLLDRPEIKSQVDKLRKVPGAQWLGHIKRAGFGWMVAAQDALVDDHLTNRR